MDHYKHPSLPPAIERLHPDREFPSSKVVNCPVFLAVMDISAILNPRQPSPEASSAIHGTTGNTLTSSATSTFSAATIPHLIAQSSYHDSSTVTAGHPHAARTISPPSHYHSQSKRVVQYIRPAQVRPADVMPTTGAVAHGQKRLAQHPQPAELPHKKKKRQWSPEEDRLIIELHGKGMKWEDISNHFP